MPITRISLGLAGWKVATTGGWRIETTADGSVQLSRRTDGGSGANCATVEAVVAVFTAPVRMALEFSLQAGAEGCGVKICALVNGLAAWRKEVAPGETLAGEAVEAVLAVSGAAEARVEFRAETTGSLSGEAVVAILDLRLALHTPGD